ncbi:putative ankyrin protein [Botrytis cinerea BcDW1]|nr:putative ankyrin protein [Botrytis cinerea BcDW1]
MPVHFAAEAGHEEIVKALLDALPRNVDWCLHNFDQLPPGTKFPSEADGYEQAFFEALIDTQAITQNGKKQPWVISEEKWTPEFQETLRNGIISELKVFDRFDHSISSTTLMRAVMGRHEKNAARNGDTKIVSQLIEYRTDPNAITDMQDTCLHEAAENGHAKAVEELLHVAYVDARDDLGRTPLHCACLKGNEDIINHLLDANTDVLVRDHEMRTPLEIAIEVGVSDRVRENIQSRAMWQKAQF